jgi:probable F420-dependent oxidoreductase
MEKGLTFAFALRQDIAMQSNGEFDGERFADVVLRAERLGYDHVVVNDHVFLPTYWGKVSSGDAYNILEPFPLLSYLAARTSTIELVISCLVVPYRQPIVTAKAVATLDQLSGGRFALGVVPGYVKEEFEAFRLPLLERSAMTNEFVHIMIELWTNDVASYQGQYYRFEGIELKPKCARHPRVPIWVGGSSLQALRRVADFGDVWNPMGFDIVDERYRAANEEELAGKKLPTGGTTPKRLRQGLDYLQHLAETASRDLSALQVIVYPGAPVDEEGGPPLLESVGDVTRGGPRVLDWLGRYVEAGATGFVIAPPGDSLQECGDRLEQFAAEVIGQL